MEYRFLGSSGLQVSALSLGSWITFGEQVGEDLAHECMQAAYDSGVNFFDNAEAYADGEAEIIMGNIVKKAGWKRSDLVISTKIFWGGSGPNDKGLSRKHIFEGIEASLARLQMEYVDLVFCHRPDPYTPIADGLGCSIAQLALAWCLKNHNINSVITGASRPEHVSENMRSLDIVEKLTDEIMDQIESILDNRPEPEPDPREW